MPTVQANGLSMYYEIHGAGPQLVIINGLGSDLSQLGPLITPLSEAFTVLAFDNRGAGRTEKPDEPYSIPVMAEDAAAVMRAAGFDRAAVLGISMGGRMALQLALAHPQMVQRLLLVSTAARTVPTVWRRLLFAVMPRLPVAKGRYPQPYYSFRHQRRASSSYDGRPRLHEIAVPTLILHGEVDHVIPLRLAEETHAGIRGSAMRTFEGGHLFFLFRQRDEFLDAVRAFGAANGL